MQLPLAQALRVAADAVAAVIGGRALDDALAACWAAQRKPTPAARAAVQDLAYTALRAYGRGDFFLARLMPKALSSVRVRALLLVALARLDARLQDAHVTVDQAVEAAAALSHGRFKALVNGVLRSFLRRHNALEAEAAGDEEARWQHPAWWLAQLRADHPGDWERIADIGNRHPPMMLRVNRRRIAPDGYLAHLAAAGIEARQHGEDGVLLARPLPISRLPGFSDGLASVQDLGAQQAATLLDACDDMRVLDACAAPGGKAAHLLERAKIDLTALDVDAARMTRVRENLVRLGLDAHLVLGDCRDPGTWWDGRPFERILADVPCSASGVVRRHPDIKWLRREADIGGLCARQSAILDALWQMLVPGGKLLYATCSVFAAENSRQIADFGPRHSDCARQHGEVGFVERQMLPQHEHDGFYYALIEKKT